MNKKIDEQLTIHGVHRFSVCDMSSKKALSIQARLLELAKKPFENRKEWEYWSRMLRDTFLEYELVQTNLVAKVGRSVFAQRLAGITTYTGAINYGVIGTSTTSPSANDTQLGTEIFRKAVSSIDSSGVANCITIFSFFFSTTDFVNANVNEFGTVIDGTASANTGQLLSHIAFAETINKTALKTLTVDSQYTIS